MLKSTKQLNIQFFCVFFSFTNRDAACNKMPAVSLDDSTAADLWFILVFFSPIYFKCLFWVQCWNSRFKHFKFMHNIHKAYKKYAFLQLIWIGLTPDFFSFVLLKKKTKEDKMNNLRMNEERWYGVKIAVFCVWNCLSPVQIWNWNRIWHQSY